NFGRILSRPNRDHIVAVLHPRRRIDVAPVRRCNLLDTSVRDRDGEYFVTRSVVADAAKRDHRAVTGPGETSRQKRVRQRTRCYFAIGKRSFHIADYDRRFPRRPIIAHEGEPYVVRCKRDPRGYILSQLFGNAAERRRAVESTLPLANAGLNVIEAVTV